MRYPVPKGKRRGNDRLFVRKSIHHETNHIMTMVDDAVTSAVMAAEQRWQRQLNACQVVDIGIRDTGFIVIAAKVNGKDFCQIFAVPDCKSILEWKQLTNRIADHYGVRHMRIDAPPGLADFFIRDLRRVGL